MAVRKASPRVKTPTRLCSKGAFVDKKGIELTDPDFRSVGSLFCELDRGLGKFINTQLLFVAGVRILSSIAQTSDPYID
jgi:hypothetical protein